MRNSSTERERQSAWIGKAASWLACFQLCGSAGGWAVESTSQGFGPQPIPAGAGAIGSSPGLGTAAKVGGATNKLAFAVTSVPRTIHGGINVPGYVLTTEKNKFSFLPPAGWLVQSSASEKVIRLVRREARALISVQVVENRSTELTDETIRQNLFERYPGARILEEFTTSALGQAGAAFEIEWRAASGKRQRACAVFARFPGGFLDCVLTPSPEQSGSDRHDFNSLLLSLRRAPRSGTIELQPVTPE